MYKRRLADRSPTENVSGLIVFMVEMLVVIAVVMLLGCLISFTALAAESNKITTYLHYQDAVVQCDTDSVAYHYVNDEYRLDVQCKGRVFVFKDGFDG